MIDSSHRISATKILKQGISLNKLLIILLLILMLINGQDQRASLLLSTFLWMNLLNFSHVMVSTP